MMSTTVDEPQDRSELAMRLEMIGQLAAGIAHEINTPVQYVGDNIRFIATEIDKLLEVLNKFRELAGDAADGETLRQRMAQLQSDDDDELDFVIEEIPAALKQTLQGIDSIAGIVRSLKSLVHTEGSEKVQTDVNQSIEQAMTLSRNEWKDCAEVDLNLAEDLPAVLCYPGELNQVLINLIVNAAHAIEDSKNEEGLGRIAVSSFVYKNSVGIMIEDTGTGIPLEIQHRVFDPFFTSKEVGKGTGQGLSIAHASIVERNGGTLFFETSEGMGTTFHIYLPSETE